MEFVDPDKVNICCWRAACDRLPTRPHLQKRGIILPSLACPLCDSAIEDIDHLFCLCPRVRPLWHKVWSWDSRIQSFFSLLIEDQCSLGVNKRLVKAFQGTCMVAVWATWKWPNRIIHSSLEDSQTIKDDDLFPSVQGVSLIWLSNRCNITSFDKSRWVTTPRNCFLV